MCVRVCVCVYVCVCVCARLTLEAGAGVLLADHLVLDESVCRRGGRRDHHRLRLRQRLHGERLHLRMANQSTAQGVTESNQNTGEITKSRCKNEVFAETEECGQAQLCDRLCVMICV